MRGCWCRWGPRGRLSPEAGFQRTCPMAMPQAWRRALQGQVAEGKPVEGTGAVWRPSEHEN